jgi:glycosyltransferase involved in cell wall biosynthesis
LTKKPTLNWFSPLPPARTAIAEYSAALLDDLSRFWDVVPWAEGRGAKLDGRAVRDLDPAAATFRWLDLNRTEATVYHIGNNADHHSGAWSVLRRHPGILILHELLLADFVAQAARRSDFGETLSLVERHFGPAATPELVAAINGNDVDAINERFPLFKVFVDQASGTVVHSRAAYDEIKEYSVRPAIHLDLPYVSERTPLKRNGPGPVFRFVMLGHIGRNRLLECVLQALSHFADRKDWRLDIYGEIQDVAAIRLAISALGLRDVVGLNGFVDAAALRSALVSADLAFNLRYPTLGEASYSQLTLWNYAVPTIVSDSGWYADLPPNSVYAIDPRQAMPELARAVAAFLAEPTRFAEIGRCGRQTLEELHGPSLYVERLTDFIERVNKESGAPHAAETMARRTGQAWRELNLPWQAERRFGDRCASVIGDIAGVGSPRRDRH